MENKELKFEEQLFDIVFNYPKLEEGYLSSENIPDMYDNLRDFLAKDPDKLLTAYGILYEIEKYVNFLNQRIKDMISEGVEDKDIPDGGFCRGNKRITLQKKVNYDYSSCATLRNLDKQAKALKKVMQDGHKEGKTFVIDPVTKEKIPCASIKSVSTSVVVNTLKNKDI